MRSSELVKALEPERFNKVVVVFSQNAYKRWNASLEEQTEADFNPQINP